MKLVLVSDDIDLEDKLKSSGYFEVKQQNHLHSLSSDAIEILVISDRLVDKNLLLEKVAILTDIKHIFYLISEIKKENDDIEMLCRTNNIYTISPQQSRSNILSQIVMTVLPKSKNDKNLFAFLGADNKVGTTTVVQSLGYQLSQNTNKKVLMVSLSNRPNDEFIVNKKLSIDTLRNKLAAEILTFEDILEASYSNKDFYYLPGPRNLLSFRKYSIEDISHFIDILAMRKDFIILIDLGSELDNPLTTAALQKVLNRYLITTPNQSAYEAFKQVESQILSKEIFKINSSDFLLILNKYDDIEDEEPSKIADDYGATFIGALPLTSYERLAEKESKVVSFFSESFNQKLSNVTRVISAKAEIEYSQLQKENGGILKKIFGRGSSD